MSSKNCDFSKNCEKLEKSQFLLKLIKSTVTGGRKVPRKNLDFSKKLRKIRNNYNDPWWAFCFFCYRRSIKVGQVFVNEVLGKYLLLYDSTLHPLFIVD